MLTQITKNVFFLRLKQHVNWQSEKIRKFQKPLFLHQIISFMIVIKSQKILLFRHFMIVIKSQKIPLLIFLCILWFAT